jgi:hypothetical protein
MMRQQAHAGSELARLLERIQCAYAAAQQGLAGLAQGTASHQFIDAKLQRLHQAHQQLAALVGPEEARTLLAHAVWTAEELDSSSVVAPPDRWAVLPDDQTPRQESFPPR